MASIGELLRARNDIAVWEQENGREASPDDLMVILYNEKVDRERRKRAAQKRRKQKTVLKYIYINKEELMLRALPYKYSGRFALPGYIRTNCFYNCPYRRFTCLVKISSPA